MKQIPAEVKKTVFVGLSGGVDSAVSAALLKEAGYRVVGVFIKVWHPDFLVCNWEQERLDAMRVAAHLEIPFLTCDAVVAYRDEVAKYFIESYRDGHTPNPDVLCNQKVKFGAFLRFAREHGADYIATGHYARRKAGEHGPELWRGVDTGKDQSYFLYSLNSEQLGAVLFPVGGFTKATIRKKAKTLRLPVATKKDSQGVCFLGHVDIPEFLSHYIDITPGLVVDISGKIIGKHKGAFIYTIGQRHGFTLDTQDPARPPQFVVAKDISTNTITVAARPALTSQQDTYKLGRVIFRTPPIAGETAEVQFRYRQKPIPVTIEAVDTEEIIIRLLELVETPAVGQACVLYRAEHCLGGGTLME